MGTYTDSIEADSETYTKYTWLLFKGTDGADGSDGTSVSLKGSVEFVVDLPTTGNTTGDL
jgi:hypothetical protein